MATTVSQPGYFNLQALTDLGALAVGGRIYTFASGTTTKKNAYTEATGTTVHTYTSDGVGGEYIALNARGELPAPLYLTSGAYDITYKTAAGATVWTRRADPASAEAAFFTQAGAGALATTVQAKLRESVSVLDFGVNTVPGTTPMSTAIQAAINSGAGDIYIPDGDYLIDADLIVPDNVCLYFSKRAVFKASANGRIFFKSTTHAYFSQIHNAQLYANGKTTVVGFDMTNFRLQAGIFNAKMYQIDTGFIGRQGCFGTTIENPTTMGVNFPIVLIENNSGLVIQNPNFDGSSTFGGSGTGIGVTIQSGSGSNLGARVIGGYIQGFDQGIVDAGIGTLISEVYFEACITADIFGTALSRNGEYRNCGHWGPIGATAYKLRNTDGATIFGPVMGSGARPILYDVDATNTNCTEYRSDSTASINSPTGSMTYMASLTKQTSGTFTPVVVGSSTAGVGTYSAQVGRWSRTGNVVHFDFSVTWSAHTGTGSLVVTGIPTALAPSQYAGKQFPMQVYLLAFTGPILYAALNGTSTNITGYELAATGAVSLLPIAGSGTVYINGAYELT